MAVAALLKQSSMLLLCSTCVPLRLCRIHVDAAWAGTSGLLPEMQHYFEGLDQVGGPRVQRSGVMRCVRSEGVELWVDTCLATSLLRRWTAMTPTPPRVRCCSVKHSGTGAGDCMRWS